MMRKFLTLWFATSLLTGVAYAELPGGLVGESTNVTGSGASRSLGNNDGYGVRRDDNIDKRTGIDRRRLKTLEPAPEDPLLETDTGIDPEMVVDGVPQVDGNDVATPSRSTDVRIDLRDK